MIIESSKFVKAVSSAKGFLKKLKTKTATVGITSDSPSFFRRKAPENFSSGKPLIKKISPMPHLFFKNRSQGGYTTFLVFWWIEILTIPVTFTFFFLEKRKTIQKWMENNYFFFQIKSRWKLSKVGWKKNTVWRTL